MQKAIRIYLSALLIFSIASCGRKVVDDTTQPIDKKDSLPSPPKFGPLNRSEVISFPCAIILSPTERDIDSLTRLNSEDFYTAADDNMYYLNLATHFLDAVQLKIIESKAEGNIKFHLASGKDTTYSIAGLYWAILLFNGKDHPRLSEITDFETDYNLYMQRNK